MRRSPCTLSRSLFEDSSSRSGLSRPGRSVLLLEVTGHDSGEHGDELLRILDERLDSGPAFLFVDARHTRAASTDVSHRWAQWLSQNRGRLLGIHLLPGSWFVRMTLEFVRRYAQLDDRMHVHASSAEFETALQQTTPG